MNWYEHRGYVEDPFSTGKDAFIDQTVNLTTPVSDLLYNIEAGNMVLVEGSKGTGKTTLLFSAIENLKGERKVIYFDCSKDAVDMKKLMQNKYGLLGQILNLTPRGMILMLDNFTHCDKQNLERAKYYYDNNYLRSLVFVGNEKELPDNIRDRIGPHIIKLKTLNVADAVQLVKNRLGTFDYLPEKVIKQIYKKSKRDATKFLENCGRVCEAAGGTDPVKREHLSILSEKNG